jgi:3-deoxy-manno-octulosonate cytidylyltransferase (CMP-KDO synthetase)
MFSAKHTKVSVIIPCRYGSTRLPGKSLMLIGKMPMLWHVYQQAKKSIFSKNIYVATDDIRIVEKCKELNLNYLLTSSHHETGTDRVAECANYLDSDIFINVQGDEPFIDINSINSIGNYLLNNHKIDIVNGYANLESNDFSNRNVVKVELDQDDYALQYCRLPTHNKSKCYYKQLGLYAFRTAVLKKFNLLKRKHLEISESVEMYRFLENNILVKMIPCKGSHISVDTADDLKTANILYNTIC